MLNATHFQRSFRGRSRYFRSPAQGLLFVALITVSATLSCSTPHATLLIIAPPTAAAGTPFTITVTAFYQASQDTVLNSVVQFTSSDAAAVLPGAYKFTTNDAGSHTWTNGVTLMTPGKQTITATMEMETGITGTAQVTVSAPGNP